MRRRIVEATWLDAGHLVDSAWTDRKDAATQTPVKVRTIGYVLRDDKTALILASGFNGHEVSGVAIIPRGMVQRVRELDR